MGPEIGAAHPARDYLNGAITGKTSGAEKIATEKGDSPEPAACAADAGFGTWIPAKGARRAPRREITSLVII